MHSPSTYWYEAGDTTKARSFADKAKSLAVASGFEKGKVKANTLIASIYYAQEDYPGAIKCKSSAKCLPVKGIIIMCGFKEL